MTREVGREPQRGDQIGPDRSVDPLLQKLAHQLQFLCPGAALAGDRDPAVAFGDGLAGPRSAVRRRRARRSGPRRGASPGPPRRSAARTRIRAGGARRMIRAGSPARSRRRRDSGGDRQRGGVAGGDVVDLGRGDRGLPPSSSIATSRERRSGSSSLITSSSRSSGSCRRAARSASRSANSSASRPSRCCPWEP